MQPARAGRHDQLLGPVVQQQLRVVQLKVGSLPSKSLQPGTPSKK